MENPFDVLVNRLNQIQAQLAELQAKGSGGNGNPATEQPIGKEDAAKFLNISVNTLNEHIRRLPRHKNFGQVYFYRSELNEFLKSGSGILPEPVSAETSARKTRRSRQSPTLSA